MKLDIRESYDVRAGKTYPAPLVRIGDTSLSDIYAGTVTPVKLGDDENPVDFIRVQPIFTKETYSKRARRTGQHLVTLLSVKRGDPRETMSADYEPEFTELETHIISGKTRLELMDFLKTANGRRKDVVTRELSDILNRG